MESFTTGLRTSPRRVTFGSNIPPPLVTRYDTDASLDIDFSEDEEEPDDTSVTLENTEDSDEDEDEDGDEDDEDEDDEEGDDDEYEYENKSNDGNEDDMTDGTGRSRTIADFLRSYDEHRHGMAMVVEEVYESFHNQSPSAMGIAGPSSGVFTPARYPHIRRFHITNPKPAGQFAIYQDLFVPHYQLSQQNLRQLLVDECPDTPITLHTPNVYAPGAATIGFVNVWRQFATPEITPAIRSPGDRTLRNQIAYNVLRYGRGDATRGNNYIDVGFASHISQSRVLDPLGQARSNFLNFPRGADLTVFQEMVRGHSAAFDDVLDEAAAPER